jgi:peroxiredoxin
LVAALLLCGCGSATAAVAEGAPAPDVELADLAGKQVSLRDLRGQVVLLNFWALWCGPCKAELPEFQAVLEQYGPQGLSVVTVDLGDPPDKVAAYLQDKGYTFVTLVDPALKAGQTYDTRILPLSVLIDRQGVVRYKRVTAFEPGDLPARIEALLDENP